MKTFILLFSFILSTVGKSANVPLGSLPLGTASTTTAFDSFPYVDATTNITRRLYLWDLINVPPIAGNFLSLPTPHNYGVVISGASNVLTALTPSASTALPLVSGGASASPSWSILGIAGGGTGVTSPTTSPLAAAYAAWDSQSNLSAMNFLASSSSTVTSAGNTILTVSSREFQYFTGTTTHTITLPVVSTLTLNQSFTIVNMSTGTLTVNSSGGNLVGTILGNSGGTKSLAVNSIATTGTTAAAWSAIPSGGTVTSVAASGPSGIATWSSAITGSGTLTQTLSTQTAGTFLAGPTSGSAAAPTFRALLQPIVTRYLSGSGVHTIASTTLYVTIEMVGGGGGGGGANNATPATNAGSTVWSVHSGSAIVTCSGGGGGVGTASTLGLGGNVTVGVGSPTMIHSFSGGDGGGSWYSNVVGIYTTGGYGASSFFGGAGASIVPVAAGQAAKTNTGSGGGGGGTNNVANLYAGTGGGAGAYAKFIPALAASYDYAVGAGTAGAAAGANGNAGGNGASGEIIVTEYSQ